MSLLQLDAMLSESGLDEAADRSTSWIEDLDETLTPLTSLDAPAPTEALLEAFGEAPRPGVSGIRRLRVARSRSTVASVLVLAVSTVGATGLSAAANTLPPSLQRDVSDFSRHYLPFDFPRPHAHRVVPARPELTPPPARHPLTGRPAEQPATQPPAPRAHRAREHHVPPERPAAHQVPAAPSPGAHAVAPVHGHGAPPGQVKKATPKATPKGNPQVTSLSTPATTPATQGEPEEHGSGGRGDSSGEVDHESSGPRGKDGHKLTTPPPGGDPSEGQPGAGPPKGEPKGPEDPGKGHGQENGPGHGNGPGTEPGGPKGKAQGGSADAAGPVTVPVPPDETAPRDSLPPSGPTGP